MPTIQQLMKDVSELDGKISFPDVVKHTTGYDIIPLDFQNKEDLMVLNELVKTAKNFIAYSTRTHQRYEGSRINEVGKRIEEAFVEELRKSKLEPELLTKQGYPDILIKDPFYRITYLESKAVSKDWDSDLRSFYYTNGVKIEHSGRHLLIAWKIVEESAKYWKLSGWKLCDLAYLGKMDIKLEFNSNNKALYSNNLIIDKND